ncbi:UV radiation resistance-associated gene protein isoform X1 [Scyliorhinus canicula]|uniref:UV radiation resistance-associated gene protein isoform X1 n=2 Tax=Scyliorhinus canicula TaxID=7830 RepID=UPI0018F5A5CE|nr:UV radiation resistance-associated gene protein isoform X1 [Scyliorhinus canicula]
MNARNVSSSRAVHVELTSQQRRLRHLRSIAARNIINRNGSHLLDTYFSLHLCDDTKVFKAFYTSEVVKDSLNPTWRSLDFGLMPDRLDTSVSCFLVRIWGGKKGQYHVVIEWKVNLDGLKYLGQQIRARNPNEVIFGLNDGYYGTPFDHKDLIEKKRNSLLQVEQSSVRNSYSVFSLLRLHTAQRAIKQTQVTVQKVGKEIEEKLRLTASTTKMKKERERLQLKILVLRNELERQEKALGRELEVLQKERIAFQDKEKVFTDKRHCLQVEDSSLDEKRKECIAKREHFLKTNAQLNIRCRQLLSELFYIYPVEMNDQKDYFMCGVKLPNSEDFQAKDEGSISVALGYTAHLVLMISYFLQMPLRYPIIQKGSRSTIRDNITDKLSEKEREFPLYPRGGERFQFEYGVYLLNKNIAQLRYQHGLSTPDLRQTLPNLKNFMEQGLMVKCDRPLSSAIPVPRRRTITTSAGSDLQFHSRGLTSPERTWRQSHGSCEEDLPPSYNAAMTCAVTLEAQLKDDRKVCTSILEVSDDTFKDGDQGKDVCGSFKNGVHSNDNGMSYEATQTQEIITELSSEVNGMTSPNAHAGSPGSLPSGDLSHPMGGGNFCSVERAEEIIGMEATGFSSEEQLEGFCIPIDHAVAVESDAQVLAELDAEGFEEFSRRICALNENISSFRRNRKGSEK